MRRAWFSHIDRQLLMAFLALLSLALILGCYLFGVQRPELAQKKRALTALERKLEVTTQKHRQMLGPRQAFALNARDLDQFRSQLLPRKDLDRFIEELHAAAEENRLKIRSVQYVPKALPEFKLHHYRVQFSVAGNYKRIRRFIHRLEASEQLLALQQIQLADAAKDKGVRLALTLDTYFRTDMP